MPPPGVPGVLHLQFYEVTVTFGHWNLIKSCLIFCFKSRISRKKDLRYHVQEATNMSCETSMFDPPNLNQLIQKFIPCGHCSWGSSFPLSTICILNTLLTSCWIPVPLSNIIIQTLNLVATWDVEVFQDELSSVKLIIPVCRSKQFSLTFQTLPHLLF